MGSLDQDSCTRVKSLRELGALTRIKPPMAAREGSFAKENIAEAIYSARIRTLGRNMAPTKEEVWQIMKEEVRCACRKRYGAHEGECVARMKEGL